MGLGYRRSVRLIPGLRLHVARRRLSLRGGPRGASMGLGRRGTLGDLGRPGTGLSARTRLTATPSQRRREVEREHTRQLNEAQREQNAQQAAEINAAIEDVVNIHWQTPAPDSISFVPQAFPEERPKCPTLNS